MIDYIVKRILIVVGNTEDMFVKNELLEVIHTLENKYGIEVPNMFEEFDKMEEE
tara:strand:- start:2515 stop:2676 length:162 start_codon:yes stop_codon:yes gene_type:complete